MPNFRGTRFTNAHETLIWASAQRGQPLHLQLSRDEGAERRTADALGLGAADLRRRRAGEGPTASRRIRRRSPRPCSTGCCSPAPTRATSCSIPSSAPARPARWRGGWGAHGSGSSARAATSRSREARIDSTLELDESAMKVMASRATQPKVPFGALVESGMIAPGTCSPTRSGAGARGCSPTPRSSMRGGRARSTRSAPRCRARRPATAGPSGMSSGTGRWCRSIRCGRPICEA